MKGPPLGPSGPSVIVATDLAIARLFRADGRALVEIVGLHAPYPVHVLAFDTTLGKFSGLTKASLLDPLADALALEIWKLRQVGQEVP